MAILFSTCILTVLGFIALFVPARICAKLSTYSKILHRLLGYGTLFASQVAILLGVMRYNVRSSDPNLGTANIVVFMIIWAALETNY